MDTNTVEDILEKIEKEMPVIPERTDDPATQRDVRVAFDVLHTWRRRFLGMFYFAVSGCSRSIFPHLALFTPISILHRQCCQAKHMAITG